MDYSRIYNNLIKNAKSRNSVEHEYYEIHHIIPRCIGGTDEQDNLVRLTYKEHYVAHHLLCKMYPTEDKLVYGFFCMLRNSSGKR